MVGVLGDEPLPVLVDDDAGEQDLRRVGRRGDEQLVQVLGDAAGRDAETDAEAVVVGVAQDVGRHHAVVFGLRSCPSAGVCSATISAFIAKPPAAMTTDFALTAPVSVKCFQLTPTTAPSSTMRLVAPVS